MEVLCVRADGRYVSYKPAAAAARHVLQQISGLRIVILNAGYTGGGKPPAAT